MSTDDPHMDLTEETERSKFRRQVAEALTRAGYPAIARASQSPERHARPEGDTGDGHDGERAPETRSAVQGEARCWSCDHLTTAFHREEGCWYTVTDGRLDQNLVCPCSATPDQAPEAAALSAPTVRPEYVPDAAFAGALVAHYRRHHAKGRPASDQPTTELADLLAQIADAIRNAAHICSPECADRDDDCEDLPVLATCTTGDADSGPIVLGIESSPEAVADLAATVVQPVLDRQAAEIKRIVRQRDNARALFRISCEERKGVNAELATENRRAKRAEAERDDARRQLAEHRAYRQQIGDQP